MIPIPDPSFFEIYMGTRQMGLAGADKIQPIFTGLKAQQIHGTQAIQDSLAHGRR